MGDAKMNLQREETYPSGADKYARLHKRNKFYQNPPNFEELSQQDERLKR
jgi:hypothetical protein